MESPPLTNDDLQAIYEWVDSIPVSRPKRNIARDFSDGGMCGGLPTTVEQRGSSLKNDWRTRSHNGTLSVSHPILLLIAVMLAEIVHHYFPKLVELHNYSNASSVRQKLYNWSTLNRT